MYRQIEMNLDKIVKYVIDEMCIVFKLKWCIMASKSICDRCLNRWSSGGKLYCIESQYKYSNSKKECKGFKEGTNDKYWRGKSGENRGKKHW